MLFFINRRFTIFSKKSVSEIKEILEKNTGPAKISEKSSLNKFFRGEVLGKRFILSGTGKKSTAIIDGTFEKKKKGAEVSIEMYPGPSSVIFLILWTLAIGMFMFAMMSNNQNVSVPLTMLISGWIFTTVIFRFDASKSEKILHEILI